MDNAQPALITTRHKGDLARGTSYPAGSQVFSNAFREAPQVSLLTIGFYGPVAPSNLAGDGYRKLIEASYSQHPPSISSDDEDRLGFRAARWQLSVYPILSEHRKAVRDYLDSHGLPAISQWFRDSWEIHERDGRASIVIEFDPSLIEFRITTQDRVLPAR
jgi:hypothetical protein